MCPKLKFSHKKTLFKYFGMLHFWRTSSIFHTAASQCRPLKSMRKSLMKLLPHSHTHSKRHKKRHASLLSSPPTFIMLTICLARWALASLHPQVPGSSPLDRQTHTHTHDEYAHTHTHRDTSDMVKISLCANYKFWLGNYAFVCGESFGRMRKTCVRILSHTFM